MSKRAYNPMEILNKKYELLQWSEKWQEAFENPETSGVWFVWGNSGNGKSSFITQLIIELAKFGLVFYDALEEGSSHTMQKMLTRIAHEITAVYKNILIGSEGIEELDLRLSKKRAPRFVIIDSLQFTQMSYADYLKFKTKHQNKLIIIVSHADGKKPAGRVANSILYDATLKIHIEGFRAISRGRYNPGGIYTIWEEKAVEYWGIEKLKTQ